MTRQRPQRPDGRHPARARRKRKRRPRALAIWETPTYWNTLTIPWFLSIVAGGQALIMSPLFVNMPFLEAHSWVTGAVIFTWFVAVAYLMLRPCIHLHWNVSDDLIRSTQPGRGGSHVRTWPNVDFISIAPCGPMLVVRQGSATHVWPRWLYRKRQLYTFELEFTRLRVRPLRQQSPAARFSNASHSA